MRDGREERRVLKRLAGAGGAILLSLCLACTLSFLVTGTATGKPTIFGFRPLVVMTDSMEPTIRAHSLILARPVDAGRVQTGDIIVYRRSVFLVVHRVIKVEETHCGKRYLLQGDNADQEDPPVSASQILYRVIL